MIGMLLPEFVIHDTLVSIIKLLRADLEQNVATPNKSILYRLLGCDEEGNPLQINIYNVFTQARKIIETKQNLSVNFGYNQEVANIISLHILLPSEQGESAIGSDEGYVSSDVYQGGQRVAIQDYFAQTYKATYQVMITSNNSAEVNVIYNILKSMLLMLVPHLELRGLRTPSLSGNDIVMQDDLTPVPLYHKVINLTFQYEHIVPKQLQREVIKRLNFIGNMKEYKEKGN